MSLPLERLDAVERDLRSVRARLDALELRSGLRVPAAEPSPPPRAEPTVAPPPSRLEEFAFPAAGAAPRPAGPSVPPVWAKSAPAGAPPAAGSPPPDRAPKPVGLSLEERVGGQWLNWLGAAAV